MSVKVYLQAMMSTPGSHLDSVHVAEFVRIIYSDCIDTLRYGLLSCSYRFSGLVAVGKGDGSLYGN